MAESIGKVVRKVLSKISESEEFQSALIANCVLNSFLSYPAIVLNILTIHAIRKTSSMSKPLKTLLLSLAVSDVGVGLLAQPLYISLLVRWLQQNVPDCISHLFFFFVMGSFAITSFLCVVAISVDRFLAIHLHLRYQELVIHKRVVAVVISIWMFGTFFSLGFFWISWDIISIAFSIFGVICFLLTTMIYWRIYLVFRRHKNQMQALQMQEIQRAAHNQSDTANFARLRKSAIGVFFVYIVFSLCYLPRCIIYLVLEFHGHSLVTSKSFLFTYTLIFLNSSLNPVSYCWKMRANRHVVMDILRNIMRRRQRH